MKALHEKHTNDENAAPADPTLTADPRGQDAIDFRDREGRVLRILLVVFLCVLAVEAGVLAALINAGNRTALQTPDEWIDPSTVSDVMTQSVIQAVDQGCYLDRNRAFHLTCRVVLTDPYGGTQTGVAGADVWYKLYGDDTEDPWSVFSAYADEEGYVDVLVDFDGLTDIYSDRALSQPDDLRSWAIGAINGEPQEHASKTHAGEEAWAAANWLTNSSWYKVDYRSWGSAEQAAAHSFGSADETVRERFTWKTYPEVGTSANADGTASYWGDRKWILVHDYSWIGQVWLTMCPGMRYMIDGVEYEAVGVFNQDRNNTIDVIYDRIGSRDYLILQTCDGWVDVRVIYGKPVAELEAERAAQAQSQQANAEQTIGGAA